MRISSTPKDTSWGDNYKMKNVRVVILACGTPTQPDLHGFKYYQNISEGNGDMEPTMMCLHLY